MSGPAAQGRRILIGPTEIAGIGAGLVHGLRQLGQMPELWLSMPHPFSYGMDHVPLPVRIWRRIGRWRQSIARERVALKIVALTLHRLLGWVVLALALFRFDSFIFLFGQTITDTAMELRLLRLLRRRVIFIYVGSDVRPPYMDGTGSLADGAVPDPRSLAKMSRRIRARVAQHERFADYIVNAPATAQFNSRRYINWFAMGLPRHLNAAPVVVSTSKAHRGVRILHSPSNPAVKGTSLIVEAVEQLRARGLAIELVLIEKMPNHQVLEELTKCDFVVDQVYSDTPMAGFATEAAFCGKPAVVTGYFAADLPHAIADAPVPPSLYTAPEHLAASIEQLATEPVFRQELGERARAFVIDHWSTRSVAARYLRLIEGDVPDGWWLDPANCRYPLGCGLSHEQVRQTVAALVAARGREALQVDDKPALAAALMALAGKDASCSEALSRPA